MIFVVHKLLSNLLVCIFLHSVQQNNKQETLNNEKAINISEKIKSETKSGQACIITM